MGMSRDEIIDLASRYLSDEEMIDFPYDGDLFAVLARTIESDKILSDEEGWAFCYYAVCLGYSIDEEEKPRGKWALMHLASLEQFPPAARLIKLQPTHIAKGKFQNYDRTVEIRFVKLDLSKVPEDIMKKVENISSKPQQEPVSEVKNVENKIVQFRRKQPK